ncbi:hypothetical protein AAWM_09306 [Aspergillus awamori]|uniref:Uncharacterized protein n=1 Tax=Aspergillus awamori TaxID=105351 RepID=A0A401L4C6_ASPAW|nr:hypothetical protein AAWM_09306 [Aspergillus awamori]
MSPQNMNKKSWESLSSTFSQVEVSISHDSCYASDEVSVVSTKQTTSNTSGVSGPVTATEPSLGSFLKPILKRPYSEIEEDEESESGYASENSEYDYDAIFEDSDDDDDDDMYHVSGWDDASDIMSESCDEDDAESLDGSFISFGPMVRFDTNIRYIDAPVSLDDDEDCDAELTGHELMERALASGTLRFKESVDDLDVDDIEDDELSSTLESIKQLPEEHTSDVVDLDKRLFLAYMNGINGIPDLEYKARLRKQANDFYIGRLDSPYLDLDSASGTYFDNVLNHVIGLFRNIVAKEDFGELASLVNGEGASERSSGAGRSHNKDLLAKIENLLSERLACDTDVGPDELSFFTSGVAYALENWNGFLVH